MDQSATEPADQFIREGSAVIKCPPGNQVFYNPVQQFNRDLSILAISVFADLHAPSINAQFCGKRSAQKDTSLGSDQDDLNLNINSKTLTSSNGINILEALSASGLRSVRYAKEIPNLSMVLANDLDPLAVQTIQDNASSNGVSNIIKANCDDACELMRNVRLAKAKVNSNCSPSDSTASDDNL